MPGSSLIRLGTNVADDADDLTRRAALVTSNVLPIGFSPGKTFLAPVD